MVLLMSGDSPQLLVCLLSRLQFSILTLVTLITLPLVTQPQCPASDRCCPPCQQCLSHT